MSVKRLRDGNMIGDCDAWLREQSLDGYKSVVVLLMNDDEVVWRQFGDTNPASLSYAGAVMLQASVSDEE